jgi:hypothetical protein
MAAIRSGEAEVESTISSACEIFHCLSAEGQTYPCPEALEEVTFSFNAPLYIATHAVEDLFGARAQAISVAIVDFVASLVNDAGFDAAPGHPVRRHQPGRTSANDEADVRTSISTCTSVGVVDGMLTHQSLSG